MSIFDMGGGASDFLSTLERRVALLLEQHGFLRSTDATSAAASAGPFALLSELEAPEEGYDDRPAIEKLLASVSAAAKKMKLPQTHNFRIIGCHPESCAALLIIAGTYQPVPATSATDLSKLGRWSLAVRDPAGTKTHEGDVMDITSLVAALSELAAVCALLQNQLKLSPIQRPSYGGGFMPAGVPMPLGGVEG
jgi:hypothetical protein